MLRPISPNVVKSMLADGAELALIDVREDAQVPEKLVAALARLGREALALFTLIDEGKRGLVYIDGRLVRELGAGTYGFWNAVTAPRIEVLELRRQTVEVTGQEILTKDKVTVRVNVSAVYEIVNVVAARAGVKDVNETLYRALQIAVRQTLESDGLAQAPQAWQEPADAVDALLARRHGDDPRWRRAQEQTARIARLIGDGHVGALLVHARAR